MDMELSNIEVVDDIQKLGNIDIAVLCVPEKNIEILTEELINNPDVTISQLQNNRAELTALIGDLSSEQQWFVENLAKAVDAKSNFKNNYSHDVADLAREISTEIGLNEKTKDFKGTVINITKIIPIINAIGASVFGLKKVKIDPPDVSISINRIICAVTVVPMLAPIITPIDCLRDIIPEFTKPTTITVVADEL